MSASDSGPQPVTLNSVAERAGVSRATASRAFSQPHRLRAETVRRVLTSAEELGYRPNPVVKSAPAGPTDPAGSGGRSQRLALVVADSANPFFAPMIEAVETRADRAGYSVVVGNVDEDPAREDELLTGFSRQVDGFVVASSRMNEAVILAYAKVRPLVLVNRDLSGVPRVLIDTTRGVTEAVDSLADLGHREITYLSGPARSWSNAQRRGAVRLAGELRGMSVAVTACQRSSYEAGRQAAEALLGSGSTAVIAFDDLLAYGVLSGLAERGVSVPDDFSVVGCDDAYAAQPGPQLTTVTARSAEAGTAAVDLLTRQLDGGVSRIEQCRSLTAVFVPGATTAEPPVRRPRPRTRARGSA